MLVTDAKKAQKVRVLNQIPCIHYSIQFQKDKSKDILAFLNFGSEINEWTLAYMAQLGCKMRKTDVNAQKTDELSLAT